MSNTNGFDSVDTCLYILEHTVALSHLALYCVWLIRMVGLVMGGGVYLFFSMGLSPPPLAPQPISDQNDLPCMTNIHCWIRCYILFLITMCCQLITYSLGKSIAPLLIKNSCFAQYSTGDHINEYTFKHYTSQEKCRGRHHFPVGPVSPSEAFLPVHKIIFTSMRRPEPDTWNTNDLELKQFSVCRWKEDELIFKMVTGDDPQREEWHP